MIIDDKLKWDEHINTVKQKLNRSLFAINKAKQVLPSKHLITLYYTLVYPYLTYGINLWGAACDTHLNKLIIMQKKLVRSIAFAKYDAHTEPLFKKLGLLKLHDIYRVQISKFTLSHINGTLPLALNNIFTMSNETHDHRTRHSVSLKFQIPKVRTSTASRSIAKMGPEVWNKLSPSLYTCRTTIINSHQTLVGRSCFSARFKRFTMSGYDDR